MDTIIETLPSMLGEQYIQNLTTIFQKIGDGTFLSYFPHLKSVSRCVKNCNVGAC